MRSWLVKTHRWIGLAVGIFFVFLGLTGSILAFYPELDRSINPHLDVRASGKSQSVKLVLDSSKSVFPDKFLHSIFFASEQHRFHQVWFTPSGEDSSLMWEVMVHPDTAEVIGHRQAVPVYEFTRENLVNTIYTLHLLMFVGPWSYIVLGVCGVFLLVTLLIGVWLWWPTTKSFLLSVSVKRGASSIRRIFDLHRVFGIYGFVFLFVISVSGIYLSLPRQIESVLGVEEARQISSVPNNTSQLQRMDLEGVLERAAALGGEGLRLKSVWMPTEATNVWRVTYSDPANIGRAGSDVILLIDARTGVLVSTDRYETDSSVQRLLRWQLPLHSGKALGTWGRVAVLLSGFVPLALFITGLLIWRRKQGA
jgi:uncharacterized iron-regulated membrane protein